MMQDKIRIAILDDHQSIIDGYLLRLRPYPEIEIVDYRTFGVDLEFMLEEHTIDVLLLDLHVPTAPGNKNPASILDDIPAILEQYPDLNILVISMYNQPTLINQVMDSGASGYILKDDYATIQDLGEVVIRVAAGEIFLSKQADELLNRKIPKDEMPSPRQLEVLSLCAAYPNDKTNDLAIRLKVTSSTVRNLLSKAYIRLGVRNRAEAIIKAQRMGLITSSSDLPGV